MFIYVVKHVSTSLFTENTYIVSFRVSLVPIFAINIIIISIKGMDIIDIWSTTIPAG